MRSRVCAVVVMAALLLLAAPSEATHQVDHRYLVLGYVRDATRGPVARATVRVVREKTGLAYETETNAEGFYLVTVHLHDEDLLGGLLINTGGVTVRIEARFEPGNTRDQRGTRVDFAGNTAREWQEAFPSTLESYLRR